MLSWKHALLLSLVTSTLSASALASRPNSSFAAGEHVSIGDAIQLYVMGNNQGKAGTPLSLPNGLSLTYGDLISFGDFYGTPGEPIAYGKDDEERKKRFFKAFNMFARNTNLMDESRQIMEVTHEEQAMLTEGIKNGEKPEDIYKKRGSETPRKINCITGGGCSTSTWWLSAGRSLSITTDNYDHFGANALIAYQTGHQAAIEEAIAARQTGDMKRLTVAYAMNGLASHYLSDRFAAGHVRVPREELATHVTPSSVGTLLAGIMHNEESPVGLHVHNTRGDRWLAYGDKSYYETKNIMHKQILQEALQLSADQILTAYQQGVAPTDDPIYNLIPYADEIGNASMQDISPLFYWDDQVKKLMRRSDLSNLYDRNWTSDWWGWSTLVALGGEKGIPPFAQAQLIREGLGKEALKAGLITDKDMMDYVQKS